MLPHGSGNGFLTYQTWISSNAYNANKVTGCMLVGDFNVDGNVYGLGKKKRYTHSVFHLFVLPGSVLHFIFIAFYVL
jgi:predicted membrane channel-forming protein YqfA (hemolysin III family)